MSEEVYAAQKKWEEKEDGERVHGVWCIVYVHISVLVLHYYYDRQENIIVECVEQLDIYIL